MICVARPLPGMLVLETEPRHDHRGSFARMFCQDELARLGVTGGVRQANLSHSERRHTLRGMHYQLPPAAETKVVSCLRGALLDVVLDLRPESSTYLRHAAVELTEDNRRLVVVPEGCAHGFMTLRDDSLAFYLVSADHDPGLERGVRWDDPAFEIRWPAAPAAISDRDAGHPSFEAGLRLLAG